MVVRMVHDSTDVLCTAGNQSSGLPLFPFHPSHYPPAIFAASIFPSQAVFLPLPLSLHSPPTIPFPFVPFSLYPSRFFPLRLFSSHCSSSLLTSSLSPSQYSFSLFPLPLFLPVCSPFLSPFPFFDPLLLPLSLILFPPHNTSPSRGSVLKAVTFPSISVDLNHFEPSETVKITASLRVLHFR